MKNEHVWLIVILAVLVTLLFGGFGWGGMMPWGMMGGYWTGSYSFMWIFMVIIWVLISIALVFGIIWLAKQIQKK